MAITCKIDGNNINCTDGTTSVSPSDAGASPDVQVEKKEGNKFVPGTPADLLKAMQSKSSGPGAATSGTGSRPGAARSGPAAPSPGPASSGRAAAPVGAASGGAGRPAPAQTQPQTGRTAPGAAAGAQANPAGVPNAAAQNPVDPAASAAAPAATAPAPKPDQGTPEDYKANADKPGTLAHDVADLKLGPTDSKALYHRLVEMGGDPKQNVATFKGLSADDKKAFLAKMDDKYLFPHAQKILDKLPSSSDLENAKASVAGAEKSIRDIKSDPNRSAELPMAEQELAKSQTALKDMEAKNAGAAEFSNTLRGQGEKSTAGTLEALGEPVPEALAKNVDEKKPGWITKVSDIAGYTKGVVEFGSNMLSTAASIQKNWQDLMDPRRQERQATMDKQIAKMDASAQALKARGDKRHEVAQGLMDKVKGMKPQGEQQGTARQVAAEGAKEATAGMMGKRGAAAGPNGQVASSEDDRAKKAEARARTARANRALNNSTKYA